MFFIVNAIDLAKDEEEVQEVLDYVQSELAENGVRNPKIFGISSKLALNEQTKLFMFLSTHNMVLKHSQPKQKAMA